jgi:hypothetical protein
VADLADVATPTAGSGVLIGTATAAVSGATVTVSVGGAVVTAAVLRGVTIAANDPVLITRQGSSWVVVGRLGTATPTVTPGSGDTSPDVGRPTSGQLVCPPVETRSWRGSWRTDNDDVYQGQYGGWGLHTGCAFYGSLPRSLAGATVTGARVHMRRGTGGTYAAQTTTLHRIAEATRPAGAPTVVDAMAGPALAVGAETVFGLPAAWAQAIVDGAAGGLSIYVVTSTPYVRTLGRGSWGPAWTLVIDWRR